MNIGSYCVAVSVCAARVLDGVLAVLLPILLKFEYNDAWPLAFKNILHGLICVSERFSALTITTE